MAMFGQRKITSPSTMNKGVTTKTIANKNIVPSSSPYRYEAEKDIKCRFNIMRVQSTPAIHDLLPP